MKFSYKDFAGYRAFHPKFYNTFYSIDKVAFREMELLYEKEEKRVTNALDDIKERTSLEYFSKIYGAQTEAVNYSEYVFPAYKFILPDTLMDDWLSVLDPHKKFCRDHSLHQPLTAYIVAKMLGYGDPEKAFKIGDDNILSICARWLLKLDTTKYLRDYFTSLYPGYQKIPEVIWPKIAQDVFYETVVISALFHDIGYPWQYIKRLNDSIRHADFRLTDDANKGARSILERISNRLLIYPFYGYSEVSKNRPICTWHAKLIELIDKSMQDTHGFPGALGFTYLQDAIRKFPSVLNLNEAIFRFVQDWAAVGVMMHDMPKIYKGKKDFPENSFLRLSFDVDPLSCMIAIADVLEEFHRPAAVFKNHKEKGVEVEFDFPCDHTEITLDGGVLTIFYRYKNSSDVAKFSRYRMKEADDYFLPETGFVNLEPLGIKEVRCEATLFSKD